MKTLYPPTGISVQIHNEIRSYSKTFVEILSKLFLFKRTFYKYLSIRYYTSNSRERIINYYLYKMCKNSLAFL